MKRTQKEIKKVIDKLYDNFLDAVKYNVEEIDGVNIQQSILNMIYFINSNQDNTSEDSIKIQKYLIGDIEVDDLLYDIFNIYRNEDFNGYAINGEFELIQFIACNFLKSHIEDATFKKCIFIDCDFEDTVIGENCNFDNCNFNNCNFDGLLGKLQLNKCTIEF